MKHFYLLLILVFCCNLRLEKQLLRPPKTENQTSKHINDNITIDDLLGTWEGTDSLGDLAVFSVDSMSYYLAYKSFIAFVSTKDVNVPPTISHQTDAEKSAKQDYDYHTKNTITFHNPKVQVYANILSEKTSAIKYDGDMFFTRYRKNGVIRDISGTLYPESNKLYITLTTGSITTSREYKEFILTRTDERQKNIDRPTRDVITPPNTLYRRDTRDPNEIFTNGFSPRGQNNDLAAHVSGISLYSPDVPQSGWVSTSASLNWVTNPAQPMPNEEFWVYVIIPNSNTYSVMDSFQHFVSHTSNNQQRNAVSQMIDIYQSQNEWAFLGNIPSGNIRRAIHYRFQGGHYQQVEIRENPGYDQRIIPSGNPNVYPIFSTTLGLVNHFFRADIRSPDQISANQGIVADRSNELYQYWGEDVHQMNLYLHSRTEERDSYGYTSISNTLERAHIEGIRLFNHSRISYIYVIARAPNIFYTSSILGRFSNREHQFSAMGGIPISQIIGWYTVVDGHISDTMTPNSNYRENIFLNLNIIDGTAGYPYAGFPLGHHAWLENPWRAFAPEYCERWDRYPELKRDVSLSWCEYNTNVKSIARFKELKAMLYTKSPHPR